MGRRRAGFSKNLYLGNESTGLSILATYACKTLKTDAVWVRWNRAFKGGLRYIVGSHDLLYDGKTTNETGEDFADNLQKGYSLKNAWKDGVSDWATKQDAAAVASGNTSSDCNLRRDEMTWQSFGGWSKLRDENVNWVCWTTWDNL